MEAAIHAKNLVAMNHDELTGKRKQIRQLPKVGRNFYFQVIGFGFHALILWPRPTPFAPAPSHLRSCSLH